MDNESMKGGAIAWMARNHVAANLVMVIFLVGGLIFSLRVKQEVFPEVVLDMIQIAVPYPGAGPAEVEQGILLAIEEEVRGLDGVKEVTSTAVEGAGTVMVELETGADPNKALQDVKNGVDRITSFPEDSERPIVSLLTSRSRAISLVLHGDVDEGLLRNLAQQVREDLLLKPGITYIELSGVRELEIAIEVPQDNLRKYNLTLDEISRAVARTAVEVPAGGVKTDAGEVLLRTAERRDFGSEFENIRVKSLPDGTHVRVADIAAVTDGFRDSDIAKYFNGERAVMVDVYRVGDERPVEISETVKEHAEYLRQTLPDTVGVGVWADSSEIFKDRIDLLVRNAFVGLALVLIILGLFLEIRLAFWVTLGIPISILGAFMFMTPLGVSINMLSLFAFIVTLGIIVDDAIVVGENVFEYRLQGTPPLEAAVRGAREIAVPVTFSILTNIAAFMPLLFIPGIMGKFWYSIPVVVIAVFAISWIESLFVLPAHLAHTRLKAGGVLGWIDRRQETFAKGLNAFVRRAYGPVLRLSLRNRYLTLSLGVAILLCAAGYVAGGRIKFIFIPKVEADTISVNIALPFGSPAEETERVQRRILEAAQAALDRHGGEAITRGILSSVGQNAERMNPLGGGGEASNSHLASVEVYLVPAGERDATSMRIANEWRDSLGPLPNLDTLEFVYSAGPPAGAAVDVELSHSDIAVLKQAASELADQLRVFAGVKDINDGFSEGKPQFDLQLKPEARSLGLTAADLAAQVRGSFYGARAFRQQRGRDEVWVMVRLPESERRSEFNVEDLLIRTPAGGEIPLAEAAVMTRGRAYDEINRRDGRRVVNVTADVDQSVGNAVEINAAVVGGLLPPLMAKHPGLGYSLEGEQREQMENNASLLQGFGLVMLAIFAMLAIPFKSYVQPIIVMMAIPFGIVGAVLGHIVMGYDLSFISMMGILALSGVVVNDSLVLIVAANRGREDGAGAFDAVAAAGMRRFRPIILTSLTTFGGLAPMIFETSTQAKFLIPMAISLGYGILFATLIILFIVPALYLIVDDAASLAALLFPGRREAEGEGGEAAASV